MVVAAPDQPDLGQPYRSGAYDCPAGPESQPSGEPPPGGEPLGVEGAVADLQHPRPPRLPLDPERLEGGDGAGSRRTVRRLAVLVAASSRIGLPLSPTFPLRTMAMLESMTRRSPSRSVHRSAHSSERRAPVTAPSRTARPAAGSSSSPPRSPPGPARRSGQRAPLSCAGRGWRGRPRWWAHTPTGPPATARPAGRGAGCAATTPLPPGPEAGRPAVDVGDGQLADRGAGNRVTLHQGDTTGLIAHSGRRPRRRADLQPRVEGLLNGGPSTGTAGSRSGRRSPAGRRAWCPAPFG